MAQLRNSVETPGGGTNKPAVNSNEVLHGELIHTTIELVQCCVDPRYEIVVWRIVVGSCRLWVA